MTRALALGVGWLATAALAVYAWVRLPDPPPRLSDATRMAVLAELRARLSGQAAHPFAGAGLERPATGPVYVSVYARGFLVERGEGHGSTLAAALDAAVPPPTGLDGARIIVDITTGEGPIAWQVPLLFAFSVNPGVDGLIAEGGGRHIVLLPDDLVVSDLLSGYAPLDFMEFEFGLAVPRVSALGRQRLGQVPSRWRRFRTESFVSAQRGDGAVAIARGMPQPGPPLTRAALLTAAVRGGMYLVDKLQPDGSFLYEYDPFTDGRHGTEYALPRHFGTAMYLAQLAHATNDPVFREPAERAFRYIYLHEAEVFDCTGTVALAALALAEYRLAAGDRYDALMRRLGDYLLTMQRPAGDFAHFANNRSIKLMYFDGEAALALVRLAHAFGDEKYRAAAKRALDWLTHDSYDFFVGSFYFGEDHWTCMAAEEAYPLIDSQQYEQFCNDYAAFLRRSEFVPGEGPGDFVGAYGMTPFFPPHTTPAASRTEAMISAYQLSARRGHAQAATRQQVLLSLGYLLSQQVRPDGAYRMGNPARADGGFMQSPLKRYIRIDFVQHAGDALLRGAELVAEPHAHMAVR
jgi:hypothetical protein